MQGVDLDSFVSAKALLALAEKQNTLEYFSSYCKKPLASRY